MNEIRTYGDGKQVVLYTEDNSLYQRLKNLKRCNFTRNYYYGNTLVGVDLYFNKRWGQWLLNQAKIS